MIDLKKLAEPFPVDQIEWRVGSTNAKKNNGKPTKGIGLAYINARHVIHRLNDVCGEGNWQNKHPHANGKTSCAIGIKVGDEWIWKENGAGDSDVEAEKGAFSDSFKRAAVLWGIGTYLYDMPNKWVPLDEWGHLTNESIAILEGELKKLIKSKFPNFKFDNKSSFGMGLDNEQKKEAYKQALERLNAASDEQALKEIWTPIYKARNSYIAEDYDDLETLKNNRKLEFTQGAQH